ncbi:MAG TPA: FAD-linked oxidase C-terminal domain-containing protein [Burkholderiales bacterium]|nr:FAD-linked oxidase C-terminal domain-containing protein [Burkholderiales bacterium]
MNSPADRNMRPAPDRAALAELGALLGDRFSDAKALCERHGQDESYHAPCAPDAVAFPRSTEEVAQIVGICARHRVPMIAYGVGTSLEGHIAAVNGGVCLDMGRMNRVLEVNAEDMDARVEAGVTRKQLNAYIKDTGLFFPVDPGADATLGGMAATRASGTTTVRYGAMRENVLGLTVVLADGRVIRTGTRARKSAAGYDLTRLFVGSEGTLGIITEISVRLYGQPQAVSSAVCPFDSFAGAVETVILTIQSGIPVARIEFLDEVLMGGINRYSKFDYPEKPTLFFEFHGTEASVAEQAEMVGEIAREHGGLEFQWALKPEERSKLWQARHDTLYAAMALRPKARGLITDVCVPISKLAQCLLETRNDIEASGLTVPIVGHVGDGNFHMLILVDPEDDAEIARGWALNERTVQRALAFGGTCTGEHGVGYGKIDFVAAEHGDAIAVMKQIKTALDPLDLMNPGKMFRR